MEAALTLCPVSVALTSCRIEGFGHSWHLADTSPQQLSAVCEVLAYLLEGSSQKGIKDHFVQQHWGSLWSLNFLWRAEKEILTKAGFQHFSEQLISPEHSWIKLPWHLSCKTAKHLFFNAIDLHLLPATGHCPVQKDLTVKPPGWGVPETCINTGARLLFLLFLFCQSIKDTLIIIPYGRVFCLASKLSPWERYRNSTW